MIKNKLIMFCVVALMLIVAGCRRKDSTNQKAPTIANSASLHDRPMLTIFIHGTRLFPKFSLQEAYYSPLGMVNIDDLDASYTNMHRIANILINRDPQRFSHEMFYLFGWSGDLDFDARKEAADDLYHAVKKLVATYQLKHGKTPRIRIITHSHGGNVALNLASVRDANDASFQIDELILLACPVQDETQHLINDPIFGKRYALFSKGDLLQRIDPQGLYRGCNATRLFSGRCFPQCPGVVQAKIKSYARPILHIEFLLQPFMRHLSAILDLMDDWYEQMHDGLQSGVKLPIISLRSKELRVLYYLPNHR